MSVPHNSISLFPPHIRAIAEALFAIFQEGEYADKVIERTLKADPRRGAGDRAFIAENVYEIVRWYRLLYSVRGREPSTVQDWWEIIGIRYLIDDHDLPRWKEFSRLNAEKIRKRYRDLKKERSIGESIPAWLDEMGLQELGDKWPATLHALNQPAKAVIRTNTLKTNTVTLRKLLSEEGVRTEPLAGDALLVVEHKSLFRTKAFQQGLFEMQDLSSQQVAPFCELAPGMRVIDACAGAGGKTLHLANLMQNKGLIIAMDTEAWKLQELKKRARRNGVHIVEPRAVENSKTIKRLHQSADRVLLDVPCSGLGVLRRNPDTKWKLNPEFIASIQQTQQDILQRYAQMVKPGGKLVYATCSILPSENEGQVARFLQSEAGKDFTLEADNPILPQENGFDGFYMARLVRKG
ncbi:MAG: methyltransferase domain-containing protein [Saprospiraceae bacterium]